MNNKILKTSVIALTLIFISSCGRRPEQITGIQEVVSIEEQNRLYNQVVTSKIANQSDGTYSYLISGYVAMGIVNTQVNGYLNYNYNAADSTVSGDFNIRGVGIDAVGTLSTNQELVLIVKALGITLIEQTQSIEIAALDLPAIIDTSLLTNFDKDACITNYRTGNFYNNSNDYDVVLVEAKRDVNGEVCGNIPHFRNNPNIGFFFSETTLKGGHINAQINYNGFDFDLTLNIIEINS